MSGSLGRVGDPESRSLVEPLAAEKDPGLRAAAAAGLQQLDQRPK